MRRPVGVKWVLLFFRWTRFFLPPSRHCRHPSIRTLMSDVFRSVLVGCSRFSRCCHLIIDLSAISRWKWARRLTQSPELGFGLLLLLSKNVLLLCCDQRRTLLVVVQRFVYFSTDPQSM